MPAGFTWDDFLSSELEIDHRRPMASFKIESVGSSAFREAWALENLQLLHWRPNREKWHRVEAA